MKLLDVITAPWAIQPAMLDEIQGIYITHLRGEKIDIASVEARLGRPLVNESAPYEVVDGVAIIPLDGVLAKRANLFTQISGGTSMQLAQRDLQAALDDPQVHSIILSIDSPGGTVDGTMALADAVYQARDVKPVVTLSSGIMTSAAYWIGSAASRAYIADETTIVGQIGVVAKHVDVSTAEAQRGVKTTEIYAGKYKRIDSQYAPLTEEGRAYMQDQVDHIYTLFVQAVSRNRGADVDTVLKDMADGRVFIGQQAIDAGLVDGVSTLGALVAELNATRAGGAPAVVAPRAGAAQLNPPTLSQEHTTMDLATLKAQHPSVYTEASAEGAAAERVRIQGVLATSMPGHEKLVQQLAFDGTTTPGEAALAVVAAERQSLQASARALSDEAPAPVAARPAPAFQPAKPTASDKTVEDETQPLDKRAQATWDASQDVRAEFGTFETYLAYRKAEASGSVKLRGAR